MFKTLRDAWSIKDIRKKLLYTLFMIIIFRLGCSVVVPFLDTSVVSDWMSQKATNGNFLEYLDILTGGALSQATIFSLSITPYINASIIMQLLTYALPPLERLRDEGEEGQKVLNKITAAVALALAVFMSVAYYLTLKNSMNAVKTYDSTAANVFVGIIIVLCFIAGTCIVVWMGNRINDNGIGNGISMILFAGIVSRIPSLVSTLVSSLASGAIKWYTAILLVIGMLLIVVFIVFITNSERRVPVQYAKRVVGRKMYGGQSTFLPIKVNMSGVLPIIFAQSIATLPATIIAFTGTGSSSFWTWMNTYIFDTKSAFYIVCYFLLIIAFSYFYATIQFNPIEIANNLKKNGGFIPGFRPGKPTSDFILKVINKITLFGALYLAIVAILPIIAGIIIKNTSLAVGGTSVIIVVGVALETVKSLEAQMLMRHYKGFLE